MKKCCYKCIYSDIRIYGNLECGFETEYFCTFGEFYTFPVPANDCCDNFESIPYVFTNVPCSDYVPF